MIHGRAVVLVGDRELLRDIYNEGKPIPGLTGLEFVNKLERLIFDDEEKSRKFNIQVEKEGGGFYEYQNPAYAALLKDPSVAFTDYVDRETHYTALRRGFQWNEETGGFTELSDEQYRQIRMDVLTVLVRYTTDFLKRKRQPDEPFLISLTHWVKTTS